MKRSVYLGLCAALGLFAAWLLQFAVPWLGQHDAFVSQTALLGNGLSNRGRSADESAASTQNLSLAGEALSFAGGIEAASPSVVSVYTIQGQGSLSQTSENANVNTPEGQLANQGSGVIISSGGLIVTSNHLIEAARNIYVALPDGNLLQASLVGQDRETDLALIQVTAADPLPALDINQSDQTRVGDLVLAIGNPYGVGQTVTLGIVSAVRRKLAGVSPLQNFVQIDAAINPGNSGGALIDPGGVLMGINTAVFSRLNGAQGIGFAIPAEVVQWVVPQLLEHGRVVRGWLGIAVEDLINYPELFGSAKSGAVVVAVGQHGPGDQAGIRVGDIIISSDERAVRRADNLLTDIATAKPGHLAVLGILRDNQALDVKVKLGERPEIRANSGQQ